MDHSNVMITHLNMPGISVLSTEENAKDVCSKNISELSRKHKLTDAVLGTCSSQNTTILSFLAIYSSYRSWQCPIRFCRYIRMKLKLQYSRRTACFRSRTTEGVPTGKTQHGRHARWFPRGLCLATKRKPIDHRLKLVTTKRRLWVSGKRRWLPQARQNGKLRILRLLPRRRLNC